MSNNYSAKRIARNTIMLYIRMIVMMAVTFYTTRVLLEYLGVEDFGIFNVLMGVITLFSFVSTSMTAATQRFLSYALGQEDSDKVTQYFSASTYLYIVVIIISILLFETIGLWYVHNYINVPGDRMFAAEIVYQFVVMQFIFLTLRIPYNSAVIAYEKMDFYAYVSVIEAVLSLGLVYALSISLYDKLIMYAFLLTLSKLAILLAYIYYIKSSIRDCKLVFLRKVPRKAFDDIFAFSGWNVFGSFAVVANTQGINLIINFFSGVVINASVGISTQLTMGLFNLVGNLQTAFNPQIIKLYAAKEYDTFKKLLFRNSRFCFFLFFLIFIPLYLCIDEMLHIWLGQDCLMADAFCRCMLIYLAIESLSYPLTIAIQADGNISKYQISAGFLFLTLIPVSYLLYKFGFGPVSIFVARIFQNVFLTCYRLIYLRRIMCFDVRGFVTCVLGKCFLVAIVALPVGYLIASVMPDGLLWLVCKTIVLVSITAVVIMVLGLERAERMIVLEKLRIYGSNKQ